MMNRLVLVASYVCLSMSQEVTSQNFGGLGMVSSGMGVRDTSGVGDIQQRCVLQCPQGYLPGTCLCQDSLFPFLFHATPCRFTKCRHGEVCRMRKGKAVCKLVYVDRPSIDVCNLPAAPGPCSMYTQRFFFDRRDAHCKIFTYGGCRGNGNSFASKHECEDLCIAHVFTDAAAGHSNAQQVALIPPSGSDVTSSGAGGGGRGDNHHTASSSSSSSFPSPLAEVCRLPSDSGPCFASFQRYFFNANTGSCQPFRYGGCSGNGNRFPNATACQQACGPGRQQGSGSGSPGSSGSQGFPSHDAECNLPQAPGVCKAYFASFYYDTRTGECDRFVYGGCQGNANRFQSRLQCERKCKSGDGGVSGAGGGGGLVDVGGAGQVGAGVGVGAGTGTGAGAGAGAGAGEQGDLNLSHLPADCLLPQKVGRCRALMERWFFNAESGTCAFFYYGGCGANANNFLSKTECERRCPPPHSASSGSQLTASSSQSAAVLSNAGVNAALDPPRHSGLDRCQLPKARGPCQGELHRYYYNPHSAQCGTFLYGGCGGNDNRFQTITDCQTACTSHQIGHQRPPALHDSRNLCLLPRVEGPCNARMPRFHFNQASGKCENFLYRGCGANANNFRSYDSCVNTCVNNRSDPL